MRLGVRGEELHRQQELQGPTGGRAPGRSVIGEEADADGGQGGERQEETGPGRRVEGPGGPLYDIGFSSVWAGKGWGGLGGGQTRCGHQSLGLRPPGWEQSVRAG